ncbi:hypothetical protein GBF38_009558 [Nibea albiflora]|uniref:Uncharacterized protein n=1 Tax=Nibea albiflora TaxID=240163 RepID=A0ACB7FBP9_NIBAL|nr:hypothetical protein GBF38_009558 [Nibea albiflora]
MEREPGVQPGLNTHELGDIRTYCIVCLNTTVLSRNTRSILFGFQRAKKSKKPGGKHRHAPPSSSSTCGKQNNATNWWIRGIASR